MIIRSSARTAAFALVTGLVTGLVVSATPVSAKQTCVLAGGEATMITEDLAKFMANAALNNSIKGMNATAAGKASMDCKPATGLTYCISRQKACKA
jgi:hypothetical protein